MKPYYILGTLATICLYFCFVTVAIEGPSFAFDSSFTGKRFYNKNWLTLLTTCSYLFIIGFSIFAVFKGILFKQIAVYALSLAVFIVVGVGSYTWHLWSIKNRLMVEWTYYAFLFCNIMLLIITFFYFQKSRTIQRNTSQILDDHL